MGMLHQRMTDVAAAALDQREYAGMNTRLADRCVDGLGDDLAGAGMRRMTLYHDRAAGCERRGRIAAGGRKGQREIRGAEDGDRTDGALDQPYLLTGRRLALGHRRIDAPVEIITLFDMIGKEPELAGRRPRSPLSRASGRPVSWLPISVIASARASISSAMARRKAARSLREE